MDAHKKKGISQRPREKLKGTDVHPAKAFCFANNVVLTAGHPFPGPFKFCNVINAALILVLWLWFELSVGYETLTEGLFTAIPAWTFLTSACIRKWQRHQNTMLDVVMRGTSSEH